MTRENEYYRDFTEEDFLADPSFQEWILDPSEANNNFWQHLQLQYPHKSVAIQNARQLLVRLKFREEFPADMLVQQRLSEYKQRIDGLIKEDALNGKHASDQVDVSITRDASIKTDTSINIDLANKIQASNNKEASNKKDEWANEDRLNKVETEQSALRIGTYRKNRWTTALKVAAVATGLILISYILYQVTNTGTTQSWSTAYGEHRSIYLPDSTLVILNSKSQVRINQWKDDQPREVWLEGEAYFDVKHIDKKGADTGRLPFTVYTSQVQIDVLGTAFDIRERRGLTEVVLQRGLINLKVGTAKGFSSRQPDAQTPGTKAAATINQLLYPGDRVVYDPTESGLKRSQIDVADYLKWREKRLLLIDPTAGEICRYLEDNFGKKILFEDSTLQYKKIEGPIMITNLDDALFVISTVLNARISKSDSVIVFRKK